jgi:cytochrome c556
MTRALKNIIVATGLMTLGMLGSAAAHTVVPGPWGPLVDHHKPLQFASEKARITYFRRNQMRAMSGHFRSIEAVISYGAPFSTHLQDDADALVRHGASLAALFPAGTQMDEGKFGAKPEIWQTSDKFARHIVSFQGAASGLRQAIVNKGDLVQALTGVRHECLACHQVYRVFEPTRP